MIPPSIGISRGNMEHFRYSYWARVFRLGAVAIRPAPPRSVMCGFYAKRDDVARFRMPSRLGVQKEVYKDCSSTGRRNIGIKPEEYCLRYEYISILQMGSRKLAVK